MHTYELYIIYLSVFVTSSFLLWGFYHSRAFANLDIPNHRSMHAHPTKKSAGLVFIGVFIISLFYIFFEKGKGLDDFKLIFQIIPGLLFCLIIGFLDDRYNLSSKKKLILEIIFFIPYINLSFPKYQIYSLTPELPDIVYSIFLAGYVIFVVNLCNFMDGIDLYLTFTVLMSLINFFLLTNSIPLNNQISLILLFVCLCSFIYFNYPPARLFMGDTGSLPLGYMVAILPFLSGENLPELGYGFLIIPVFWIDGLLTIFRRLLKKENIFQAHREHLFQRISLSYLDKRITSISFSLWNLISLPFYFILIDKFSIFFITLTVILINSILYFLLIKKAS